MDSNETCPPGLEAAMGVLGKKWTGLILRALMDGPRRFTSISGYVPGLSDRLLSQRLQELETVKIVQRSVNDQRPVLVEYNLTEKGPDLRHVFEAIQAWSDRWESVETTAHRNRPDPNQPTTILALEP